MSDISRESCIYHVNILHSGWNCQGWSVQHSCIAPITHPGSGPYCTPCDNHPFLYEPELVFRIRNWKKTNNNNKQNNSFSSMLTDFWFFSHQALALQKPCSALLRQSVPAVNCGVVRLQSNGGSQQTGTGNGNSMQYMYIKWSGLFYSFAHVGRGWEL